MSRSALLAATLALGLAPCTADVDNGRVQLRIRTDGRNVLVGVPY